jgi:hypothetical protein
MIPKWRHQQREHVAQFAAQLKVVALRVLAYALGKLIVGVDWKLVLSSATLVDKCFVAIGRQQNDTLGAMQHCQIRANRQTNDIFAWIRSGCLLLLLLLPGRRLKFVLVYANVSAASVSANELIERWHRSIRRPPLWMAHTLLFGHNASDPNRFICTAATIIAIVQSFAKRFDRIASHRKRRNALIHVIHVDIRMFHFAGVAKISNDIAERLGNIVNSALGIDCNKWSTATCHEILGTCISFSASWHKLRNFPQLLLSLSIDLRQ